VRVEDFGDAAEKNYYVMEWCERGSLEDVGADRFKGEVERALGTLSGSRPTFEAQVRGGINKGFVYEPIVEPPSTTHLTAFCCRPTNANIGHD
jgi:hypothetical protein